MLTREENEMLTRVGPGTPGGELMRRYWHPVAATVQLEDNPVRKVRILGEDLVLFQDRRGNLGLIAPRCPHRAMHMAFGIPEAVGLRCPYHGRLFQYALERQGRLTDDPRARYNSTMRQQADRLKRGVYPMVQIVYNQYGFTKGMRDSDAPEDVWQLGGPVFFPYLVYPNGGTSGNIRHDYQIGVPIDDTTTWHISYRSYRFPPEIQVPRQARVPYVEVPIQDERGEYILDYVLGQDMVAWYEQGEITDRTQEHLYEGDKVIIAYRKMLKEQIEIAQRGGDPMNVIRNPAANVPWAPTLEGWPAATIEAATQTGRGRRDSTTDYRFNFHKVSRGGWQYIEDDVDRYCPDRELILQLYEEADKLMQQQAQVRQ